MKLRIVFPALAAIILTAIAVIAMTRNAESSARDLVVTLAWARATPPGADVGAAYVTIENRGATDDRLIGVTSAAAGVVSIHETVEENGIAKMRPLQGIALLAGHTLAMQPGGFHVMLMDLKNPLVEGESVALTLTFEQAGAIEVEADIAAIGADAPPER
jgi:periplasmic copper chaperone A